MNKKLWIAGGVAVAGGAIYLAWKKASGKSSEDTSSSEDGKGQALVTSSSIPKKVRAGNDRFPLQRNSKGNRVRLLQLAIQNILGKTVFPDSEIDGIFGPHTESALVKAGLPVIVTEEIFNKIATTPATTLPPPSAPVLFDPRKISADLFNAIGAKLLEGILVALKQIRNTTDYVRVNEVFKAAQMFSVSRSIVTYLLDVAFANDSYAKEKIKEEFRRIGLVQNPSTGSWSIPDPSGVSGLYRNVITITNTHVTDEYKRKIPVRSRTVLGQHVRTANGMTYFIGTDKRVYSVPTIKVKSV